ncbi:EF-hand_domain pair [Hexamita inflata]|uniref:EF-hand domain pair n=1 Tax=Hexamita inflata TaxID=28002 RepID=A0AA86P397_9EUKA|nr:EF-hand domain pair [Hexamita inflata]
MLDKCKKAFKDCNDPQLDNSTDSIQLQFIMIPKGKNDPIEICEIHWALRKYFPDIPQRCAVTIAKLIDDSNDGNIQQSEFNKLLKLLQKVDKDDDILDIIFAASDKNQNGIMEQREFQILKEKLRLDFIIPMNPMNLQEFKQFMAQYTSQITGVDYIPFTSELNVPLQDVKAIVKPVVKKQENSLDVSASNIRVLLPTTQEDLFQQARSQ